MVTSVIAARSFEMSYFAGWNMDVYKVSPVTHQEMYLLCSSPFDGIISAGNMATVVSAWGTAVHAISAGTPTITAISPSQAGTPSPAPWFYNAGLRLSFDSTWTMVGFTCPNSIGDDVIAYLAVDGRTSSEGFTSTNITAIQSAIATALGACPNITSVTQVAQITVTPATVV